MVVTSEGVFYSYAIDLENGGECVLQKSYSLLDGIGDDSNGCDGILSHLTLFSTRALTIRLARRAGLPWATERDPRGGGAFLGCTRSATRPVYSLSTVVCRV